MIWEMRPNTEGCLSLFEYVTFEVRVDDDDSSWVISGCPGTDQNLTGGSGDGLPPAEAVLTLEEVEATFWGRDDAVIIPRNGEVRTGSDVELVKVEDYLVRITVSDPAGCPGIPAFVDGVPVIYWVAEPLDVNGRLPTGQEFSITFDPALGSVSIEGVSAAVVLDMERAGFEPADVGCEKACVPVMGIMRFRRGGGDGSTFENGALMVSSGDWTMSIAVYEHILDGWDGVDVGRTMLEHIRPVEVASGLPSFELTGPFRWATDTEIPLQMEVDYGRFVVRRGCGNLAVACDPGENVQVIPSDRVYEPADVWDYQGTITVTAPPG